MKVQIGEKVWDREAIHDLLDRNPKAVANALMVVYANQTADERQMGDARHLNGVGFNKRDAETLTDIAEKWKIWGRWASERQCAYVRRLVKKYWRQVLQHMADTNPDAVVLKGRAAAPTPVEQREPQIATQPANWGRF